MAVVAISDSNNRAEDMETSPTVVDIGAGAGGGVDTVEFFQGAQSVSRKITNSTIRGTGVSFTAVNTTTGDNQVLLWKCILYDEGDVNSVGFLARVGSSTANYYDYIFSDDGTLGDRPVPPRKGWRIEALAPNVADWHDAAGGTISPSAITHVYGAAGLASGTAKAENIYLDSIDFGDGLYMVGGDSTDADGTWQDFVDDDEGQQTAGRFGHFITNPSGIEVRGKAIRGRTSAGTVTATVFTDSLQNLTWVASRVYAGWNELEDDLGNASTVITETNTTFTGAGRDNLKRWFDSAGEVIGGATDAIDITGHGYADGDAVLYSAEGGTAVSGLTNSTRYFVIRDTADRIGLATTRANAYAGTRIGLTAAGTGQQHSLRRQPDTRPDYTATSSSGSANYTNCNFIRFRTFTLTAGVTFTSCNLVNCYSMTLGTGTLDGCNITEPVLTEGEAFIDTSDLGDVTDCAFTMGEDGHAIDIDTAGTYTFTGNTFSGYWTHSNANAGEGATFQTTSGVTGGATDEITTDEAHGFSTGDAVYYNDNGGAVSVGLTDGARYYVRAVSTTVVSMHVTRYDAQNNLNRVNLTSTGAEEHALYSTKAAIVNSSGGAVTINITGGGGSVYVRNVGASTTTVNLSVALEINGLTEASYAAMIGDGGAEDGNTLLSGYADSTGKVTGSFSGATPQAVTVRARNGGIIAACIQDDGGVFTDYTDEARDRGTADDVVLLPASPAVSDAAYFGGIDPFGELRINVTTAGATYVGAWEYWNGAWVALTTTDNTNDFQTSGVNNVTFTAPNDWATTTVNSQGPFYYVRFRVTTGGGTGPSAETVTLNETVKYLSFDGSGSIATGTGLTTTVPWQEDPNNP